MSPTAPESSAQALILSIVQNQHVSLHEAGAKAKLIGEDPEEVDAVVQTLTEIANSYASVGQTLVAADSCKHRWYFGPIHGGYWEHYLSALNREKAHGLETLDGETSHIVSLLADPKSPGEKRKGLAMGSVQSGKTRNYAGVVAKALDAGYKFVIILSGIHNNLRSQTQTRLDDQLLGKKELYSFTNAKDDFEYHSQADKLFTQFNALAAVVKKNSKRLERLAATMTSLKKQGLLKRCPVLIIDDEADQATPNSMAEKNAMSAINKHLRTLWSSVETGTYLAYTATPFANVLIDPEDSNDLFPSDFITTISTGEGYLGAEQVFGISESFADAEDASDGLNMVLKIPTSEADSLRPPSDADARADFDPVPPKSLVAAFEWFVAATAARRARSQHGHSSMLIHFTHYSDPHFRMKKRMDALVQGAAQEVEGGNDARFLSAWNRESPRVDDPANTLCDWRDVKDHLGPVLKSIRVLVDNGTSDDRLDYSSEGQNIIAVGGGTLSRGLTLEGLVVSYFTRTSNTYDTLLQMGRWFGYRPGYSELPRIWITDGLDEDYAFLARVEKDLRDEIRDLAASGATPLDVGVKVRTHPGRLSVTAQNKMYAAKMVEVGLSSSFNQTFLLRGDDQRITEKNLDAVARLLSGQDPSSLQAISHAKVATDVSGVAVAQFVGEFIAHSDQRWLHGDAENNAMVNWIKKYTAGEQWNVALLSNSTPQAENSSMTVAGVKVDCFNRTPLVGSTPQRINLKAIMSQPDLVVDISASELSQLDYDSTVDWRRARRDLAPDRGLIILYPLSQSAQPAPPRSGKLPTRMPMPANHDLIGFGIIFPHVKDADGKQGTFVSVKRTWEIPDALEGDEAISSEEN